MQSTRKPPVAAATVHPNRTPAVAAAARATVAALAALAASIPLAHPGQAQDTPLAADFPEVYRVGGLDVPEWAQFTFPGPLGFDGSGNLHVLDGASHRVVIIDPAGQLLRTVGRQGEGPGEFMDAADLVVWRDGRFVVEDRDNYAFQLFGPDGTLEHFVGMSQDGNPSSMTRSIGTELSQTRPDPRGGALLRKGQPPFLGRMLRAFGPMLGDSEPEEPPVDDRGIERVEFAGDAFTTRPVLRGWRAPRANAPGELSLEDIDNAAVSLANLMADFMYFEPQLHWDVLPDGTIAYADSSAYLVKLIDVDGSLTGVLRRAYTPIPVDRRLRARAIEVAVDRAGGANLDDSTREAFENREFFPEVPVILGIRTTWEGAVWIQRRGEDLINDPGPIDVFGTDRQYVGTIAPDTDEIAFAGERLGDVPIAFGPDGLIAFWEADELDIPIIVVKRLPEAVR